MFQIYCESIKDLVMNYASSILWTFFWNAFAFLFWVKSILEEDFLNLQIHIKVWIDVYVFSNSEVYSWDALSKFMYF